MNVCKFSGRGTLAKCRNMMKEAGRTTMGERAKFYVGQSLSLSLTISAEAVDAYAAVSGDASTVCMDESFAATTRFNHRIVPGMFVGSSISALFGTTFPGLGTIYMRQRLRFLKPVYLGDTIEVTATVTNYREDKEILTLDTTIRNQDSEEVITGEAVCLVADVVAPQVPPVSTEA